METQNLRFAVPMVFRMYFAISRVVWLLFQHVRFAEIDILRHAGFDIVLVTPGALWWLTMGPTERSNVKTTLWPDNRNCALGLVLSPKS